MWGDRLAGDFAEELRRRRLVHGYSLAELAARVHYSKGHLSKIENRTKAATADLARACDAVLNAGGTLLALVGPPRPKRPAIGPPSPSQDPGRCAWSLVSYADSEDGADGAPDLDSTDFYASLFDRYREFGLRKRAADVLHSLVPQVELVRAAAQAADEPNLWLLTARYAEYTGWMAQEAGQERAAASFTELSAHYAARAHAPEFAHYARVRAAEFALYRRDAAKAVRLASPIARNPAVTGSVRSLAAEREAQGYALAGYELECCRALDRAAELHSTSGRDHRFGSQSISEPLIMATGSALLDLGRPAKASAVFDRHVHCVATTALRAWLRFELRRALAHATAGELDHGCELATALLSGITTVGSVTLRADLARLSRLLRASARPAARELRREIAAVLFSS